MITICTKYVSKKVENRVPSDDEKKLLYSQVTGGITMRSHSDANEEYIAEINASAAAQNEQLPDTNTRPKRVDSDSKTTIEKNGENGENGGTESQMKKTIELQERHHE